MQNAKLTVMLSLAACGSVGVVESVNDLPQEVRAKAPDAMWTALVAQEPRSFIVALAPSATDRSAWRAQKARMLGGALPTEHAIEADWDHLPLIQVRATTLDAALSVLDREDAVAAYDLEQLQMTDAESFPLISQPAAVAAGKTGAGTSVAVLDTGTDYTRADFGGCTSPGTPSTCRVAYAADFAADDGSRDDHGHGTNVAGIVAGVAPGTKILALDVFTGSGAYNNHIISAINWAIANKDTYRIAALNLSLGGGSSTALCGSDAIGIALAAARAAGIAPVVASGNNGFTNALASPACAPASISVGAVYDTNVGGLSYSACSDPTTAADKITCFSNSASFLTLLAPGSLITAAGYTMAGTSQAAPHVAGAMATLRAAFPSYTVDQLVAALTSTGRRITDPRNGVTTPRIDLYAAAGATPADRASPTGSVAINGGASTTKSGAVQLAITGADPSGVAQMCISNTTTCTTYAPFAETKTWALSAGDGRKTVTVFLRDAVGNTTTATTSPSASILVDTKAPTGGAVTAAAGDARLVVRWSGFADAGSGVASYRLVAAAGTTAPANCAGTAVYEGTATEVTVPGLVNGTPYSVRACAVDRAGNLSTGVTASASPRPESNPPVGTVVINGGAALTRSRTVTLTLAATDDTQVTQMCISTTTACTVFTAYAPLATYTLPTGDGVRTVRAWYRDRWGNTSAPVSAMITVDTTAPTGGVLTSSPAAGRITLRWTPGLDTGSGLAGYKLVGAPGTALPAATCTTGLVLFEGTDATFVHTVNAKATWSYRLCARDKLGNIAAGSTRTATAL